ncbi:MAG: hypothetical protein QM604_02165 [Microbacterium sp.]
MHHRARVAAVAATGVLLAALTACSDPWDSPHAAPTAVGVPAAGFIPTSTPSPESTVNPVAGSWDGVDPSTGYRVVLLTAGDDSTTAALVSAVEAWAGEEAVELRTVHADDGLIAGITTAMDMNPDLIISAGDDLIDPLATVTANHLDVSFLIVGAEVAEPTYNVTAVDWTGAGYRGEGLGTATDYDPESFTAERCESAVRAGVAAVLTGLTGVVLWID